MSWFYNLRYGISNVYHFFKVIWNFRGYDFYYSLDVLKRCLELTKPEITGFVNDAKCQRQIQSCIDCIERLQKDDYGGQEAIDLEKRWGKLYLEKVRTLDNGNIEVRVARTNEDPKLDHELRKEERRVWELEAYRRNQDIETLFNTMKKFRSWWS